MSCATTDTTAATADRPRHHHRPQPTSPAAHLPFHQRRISADTALRLARFFGTSGRFWINLQARYDLEAEKDRLGDALDGIRPLSVAS
jgi:plasmid maintenance system antidote protein VapI